MKGKHAYAVSLKRTRRHLRLEGGDQQVVPQRDRPAARHVPWHVIAKRRARNRMAARSRRRNR
jgi:hypothetical protein